MYSHRILITVFALLQAAIISCASASGAEEQHAAGAKQTLSTGDQAFPPVTTPPSVQAITQSKETGTTPSVEAPNESNSTKANRPIGVSDDTNHQKNVEASPTSTPKDKSDKPHNSSVKQPKNDDTTAPNSTSPPRSNQEKNSSLIDWITVFAAVLAAIAGFGAWNSQGVWWARRYHGLGTNLQGWDGNHPPPSGDLVIRPHAYEGKIVRFHRISITIFGLVNEPMPTGEEIEFIMKGGLSEGIRLYNYTSAVELNTFQGGSGYHVRNTMQPTSESPAYQAQGVRYSGQLFGEERLPVEIRVRNLGVNELFVNWRL